MEHNGFKMLLPETQKCGDNTDVCENHYLQYFSDSSVPGQTLRPDNMIQMYIQRPGFGCTLEKGPNKSPPKQQRGRGIPLTVICHLCQKFP